jgi:hypothetical protein
MLFLPPIQREGAHLFHNSRNSVCSRDSLSLHTKGLRGERRGTSVPLLLLVTREKGGEGRVNCSSDTEYLGAGITRSFHQFFRNCR